MKDRAYWLIQMQRYAEAELEADDVESLSAALRESAELRRDFLDLMNLDAALAAHAGASALADETAAEMGLRFDATPTDIETQPHAHRPRTKNVSKDHPKGGGLHAFSPVVAFLHRAMRIGGETPVATALTWMIMAIFLIGTIVTSVFIGMMIFGPKPVDGPPTVAKNSVQKAESLKERVAQSVPSPSEQAPVARLIRTADCYWAGSTKIPKPGDEFSPGRKLVLRSGLAEIVFQGGARTLLEGPATLEIRSRMGAYLQQGKFTVTVENPLAKGFEVLAPGMKYTDLGTEFGVYVAANGEQEMQVFRGTVQAEELTDESSGARDAEPAPAPPHVQSVTGSDGSQSPSPNSHKPPKVFSANQGVHVAAPDPSGKKPREVERIASDEKKFIRSLTGTIPIFSTGVDLDRGAADPHWEIAAISTDANFKPQQAVVVERLRDSYRRDAKEKAQWIAEAPKPATMPASCRWTLRTRFDLAGFDPATAQIEGLASADNFLIEIRINGKSVPLPKVSGSNWLYKKTPIRIDRDFVAGTNTIEVVIENSNPAAAYDPMALCLELHGTATRNVKGEDK
jgi:hypothetical protein